MQVLDNIMERARKARKRIVLCEGDDPRVLEAAVRAAQDGIADISLVGERAGIEATAADNNLSLDDITLIDPAESSLTSSLVDALYQLRHKKGMTHERAEHEVQKPLVFADLMVHLGHADGSVAGACIPRRMWCAVPFRLLGSSPEPNWSRVSF